MGLMGYELKDPYYFLLGLLGFIGWVLYVYRPFRKTEFRFPSSYLASGNSINKVLVFALGLIAWLSLSLAMTTPRKPAGFAKNDTEINDIFFVVDVSRSMLAEDFRPNRLESAKKKIYEFIKLVPTDRIGIIMFSEKAFTLLPLTTDLNLIGRVIEDIQVGGMLGGGTNIGDALALAVARGAQSLAYKKTVILLTDGVSNVGFMTPLQAAEEAKNQDIKVYTIAIGGSKDAKMPVNSGFGGRRYVTIPGGSIDTDTLDKIASITGGKSFLAGNEKALSNVLSEIEKLERKKVEISAKIIYENKHYKFLLLGVVLLALVELYRRFISKEAE